MLKIACIFLSLAFMLSSLAFAGNVDASTPVGGLISSDTTWRVADSPFVLSGSLGVAEGVTLTIEPGVQVDFKSYYLEVNGTLNARGTNNRIIFTTSDAPTGVLSQFITFMPASTNWNEQTGAGCIIENAQFNMIGVCIGNCSPKISNNVFSNPAFIAINVAGSATISHNTIIGGRNMGICANQAPSIVSNIIIGAPLGITARGNASIISNTIRDCSEGIRADDSAVVKGNTILNCVSIGIEGLSSTVKIQNNNISNNNNYGISGTGIIKSNSIVNNSIGIQVSASSAIIKNNNILNNAKNSVALTCSQDVDATNNWWGTTDASAIAQTIYDGQNDFTLGKVNYMPFLTSPSSTDYDDSAPLPAPSTSTPTPKVTDYPSPPTQTSNQNFTIESNSTISVFAFNGKTSELSFSVAGPNGTTGYVKLKIAKTFMPDAPNAKVYIDEKQIQYTISSDVDSWFITFNYSHSEHQVKINLSSPASETTFLGFSFLVWAAAAVTIMLLLAVLAGVIVYSAKKKN